MKAIPLQESKLGKRIDEKKDLGGSANMPSVGEFGWLLRLAMNVEAETRIGLYLELASELDCQLSSWLLSACGTNVFACINPLSFLLVFPDLLLTC